MTQLKMYRNAQQAQQPDAAVNTHSSAVPVTDKHHEAAASAVDSSSATEKPSRHSSRPVTALLSGHRELAELISKSSSRYAEHLQAPSLEPSADVLQGVFCWHGVPCSCCPCHSPHSIPLSRSLAGKLRHALAGIHCISICIIDTMNIFIIAIIITATSWTRVLQHVAGQASCVTSFVQL